MSKAYYDPWKFISLEMSSHTNAGMTEEHIGPRAPGPDSFRIKSNLRFVAIGMVENGTCEQIGQAVKVPIGVITETFSHPYVITQICVEGIVPMKVADPVKAGENVSWSEKANLLGLRPSAQITDFPPIGISLCAGVKDEVIPVLLKVGGAN